MLDRQNDTSATDLTGAIEELAAAPIAASGGSALGRELVELRAAIDRLEAEFSRRLRRFAEVRGYEAEGATSLVAWLRDRCGLSVAAAAQRAEIAATLDQLPGASAMFARGELGFSHAAALARTAGEVGPEAARLAAPQLLDAARRLDPDKLRLVGRQLRHCVDPDGALADAIRSHQRRRLHMSKTIDGTFVIDGLLDTEGGALVTTALDSLSMPSSGEERTPAQRRADALVELASRQLRRGDLPSTHGQRPHLVVTAPIETLLRMPGAPAAETGSGDPLPVETLRRIACDASLTVIVLGPDGEPVGVGRARRTISAGLRRALVVRDRGCRFPGCDRPAEWTDGHHMHHRADGGSNRLPNLVLLCGRHHTFVHEQRWTLRWTPRGEIEARPP